MQTLKKLPGVMAFRRGHVVSDAEMFNLFEEKDASPVLVRRHGIRGTQNVNDGKGNENPWIKSSTTGAGGERHVSNPQTIDAAKLDSDAMGLLVRFETKFLDIEDLLDSCASSDKENQKMAREMVKDFLGRARNSQGLYEVACRYARNIANGRWLWRNRTMASSITIDVFRLGREGAKSKLASFDGLKIDMNNFGEYSQDERNVATEIVRQMKGESLEGLLVEASVSFGIIGSIEVFPSQNYVEKQRFDKKNGPSRFLYALGHEERNGEDEIRVIGRAAIRDQKIFNAIRTIDTWYPNFEEVGLPIPIEPLGASLSQQDFFRKGKYSSFEMALRLSQINPDSPEGMYMIAAIERGGVYGTSDKKNEESEKKESGDVKTEELP